MAFVRRHSGERRVGHAGTLDPFAEGVLPVCLGQATRVVEYLMDARKTYRALVRLGRETDTYDRTGTTIFEGDPSAVRRGDFERALREFEGEIEQAPPPFSAIKRDGVPMYKLARAGLPVVPPTRGVRVYRIEATSFEPPFAAFEIQCGKGTYVRSIAHDLGRVLGVGGCLETLVRTRVGPFGLERTVDVETLRGEFVARSWSERLMALDEVLLEWPAAILGPDNERKARTGIAAEVVELRPAPGGRLRAYSCGGDFIAVMRREAPGRWRPEKVFQPG